MQATAALTYWLIVAVWACVLGITAAFYLRNPRAFGTTRLLLIVLTIDAARNLIENVYFGVYFGGKYGLFPDSVTEILGNPYLLILPKLMNIAAGCLVLGLLLMRWLPAAIRERKKAETQVEHLQVLATTDTLTGVCNRRHFLALAEAEWQRFERYRRPLALLMIDIDLFKSVNDRYGHEAGDRILAAVARTCQKVKRSSDVVARLGGEEFAVLMPETGAADAFLAAERLRRSVAAETLAVGRDRVCVTISVGIGDAAGASDMSELFKQADLALYEAKRAGRDRVAPARSVEMSDAMAAAAP